jgi:hypothetical protein
MVEAVAQMGNGRAWSPGSTIAERECGSNIDGSPEPEAIAGGKPGKLARLLHYLILE